MKLELAALVLALRHPRTPWYARACGFLVLAYAISPIDLIPDFIPVLGYLDDLVLVPIGLWLVVRLIPEEVLGDCRAEAAEAMQPGGSLRWLGLLIVILLWAALVACVLVALYGLQPIMAAG